MDRAVVLQARMGSTRLPGKVLLDLGGRTILEHCVRRLESSGLPVIVATTTESDDDAVVREAVGLGVPVFRGSAHDVLGRYLGAARDFGLATVVRATADNPLVDGGCVTRTIAVLDRSGADHAIECGLPVGGAVEAVAVEALERSATLATDPYDREHVTSFMRRDTRFRALRAVAPGRLRRAGLRLTVDTPEDLEFIRRVYSGCGGSGFPELTDAIAVADALIVGTLVAGRIRQGA